MLTHLPPLPLGESTKITAARGPIVHTPICACVYLARGLLSVGKIRPDYRIIRTDEASSKFTTSGGALVADIMAGSPAARAGVQAGDVIVEFDGENIEDSSRLPALVARARVEKTVKMTVRREKKRLSLKVAIAELKEEEATASSGNLGMTVQNLTPELAKTMGLKPADGVIITANELQSPAAVAGLRRDDAILEVDRAKLTSPN